MSDIRELKERACHYNEWGPFDEAFEILLAENSKQLEAFWDANRAITHLEDCMREIQAATSDKAVLDITDKALCDEPRQNQE